MKAFRLLLLLVLIGGISVRCSNNGPQAKIKSLEQKISADDFTFDEQGMQVTDELIKAYLDYAENHKDSPEAPEYLYKAADLSLNTNKSKQALDLYNRIIYQYPDYKKTPECLFLVGYIYENYMQDYGKAKQVYEEFLQKYPNHEFADDAKISIENLGKSPEELIRSFEEKNKQRVQDSLQM